MVARLVLLLIFGAFSLKQTCFFTLKNAYHSILFLFLVKLLSVDTLENLNFLLLLSLNFKWVTKSFCHARNHIPLVVPAFAHWKFEISCTIVYLVHILTSQELCHLVASLNHLLPLSLPSDLIMSHKSLFQRLIECLLLVYWHNSFQECILDFPFIETSICRSYSRCLWKFFNSRRNLRRWDFCVTFTNIPLHMNVLNEGLSDNWAILRFKCRLRPALLLYICNYLLQLRILLDVV